MCDGPDLFLCVIAILFPPIGVWVKRGLCSADSLINIALCCLGYLPGLLHSWYIISSYPDPGYEPVSHEERVIYYVHGPPPAGGYGTVAPQGQFPGQQAGTANAFPQGKKSSPAKRSRQAPQPPANGSSSAGPSAANAAEPVRGAEAAQENSSSDAPPPSYADAVKGDNKIQD